MPIRKCNPDVFDPVVAILAAEWAGLPCGTCGKELTEPPRSVRLTRGVSGTVMLEVNCDCLFAPRTVVHSACPDAAGPTDGDRLFMSALLPHVTVGEGIVKPEDMS